ncbi:hypothetical protein Q1695_015195 [Nippostrongylus brasiliensis]|nr:hypothetical protein Q1695_015195 [Nippostrongylus brasiliensis]
MDIVVAKFEVIAGLNLNIPPSLGARFGFKFAASYAFVSEEHIERDFFWTSEIMVRNADHKRMSIRRCFRTRPSNQTSVILVDHDADRDIKLFDEVSNSDEEFALKSPCPRKPRKKKDEPLKVFTNTTNLPPISETRDDKDDSDVLIEKLKQEIDMADDFSLYIENEDGERMIDVGNKLVKYDEYYGKRIKNEHEGIQKRVSVVSDIQRDSAQYRREIREATLSFFNLQSLSKKKRASASRSKMLDSSTEINEKQHTFNRKSIATDVIEEVTESTSAETVPCEMPEEDTQGASINEFTTPKKRVSSVSVRASAENTTAGIETSFGASMVNSNLTQRFMVSPLPDIGGIPEPECASTPVLKYCPQAQSTPINEAVMVPSSPQFDEFDEPESCTLPENPLSSKVMENDPQSQQKQNQDEDLQDESNLSAAFESALHLSMGDDEQCTTLATLAEEAPLQNTERSANMSVMNSTYRNVSYLRNTSLVDVPYYLRGRPELVRDSPLAQLLFAIGQPLVIEWKELPADVFEKPRKLGEGVYGEVFATTFNGQATALKVIPFQGDTIVYKEKVNGEYLLDAASILPEILINRELSALYNPSADFSTPNFIQLLKTNVVRGLYPEKFMEAWDAFDEAVGSENDRPTDYASEQQLFITMGMAMGGVDLEHYQMKNEDQVMSALLQIAISLVVAEERLEFEHRDLHIGNALVLESKEDIQYRFAGGDMTLRCYGVKVHLIDFTLSRMSKEGTTIFRDLENDEELFTGDGDYQFDIYRMMRKSNQGDWLAFNPKSNCFWMHYLAMQLINKRKCKKAIPKKKRHELTSIWDHLLEFDSVRELFTHDDFYDLLQRHLLLKA